MGKKQEGWMVSGVVLVSSRINPQWMGKEEGYSGWYRGWYLPEMSHSGWGGTKIEVIRGDGIIHECTTVTVRVDKKDR